MKNIIIVNYCKKNLLNKDKLNEFKMVTTKMKLPRWKMSCNTRTPRNVGRWMMEEGVWRKRPLGVLPTLPP